MENVYLITGGNEGDRIGNLQQAASLIEKKAGRIIQSSALYETAAWGKTEQQDFLNQVLMIQTSLEPGDLLQSLLSVEKTMGRVRKEKYGPRTIDIDILLYGNLILNEERLQIPHPRMKDRRFVLEPLTEIAPDLVHPVFQKTIASLLMECTDPLDVRKI